jgi:hypothetical protein
VPANYVNVKLIYIKIINRILSYISVLRAGVVKNAHNAQSHSYQQSCQHTPRSLHHSVSTAVTIKIMSNTAQTSNIQVRTTYIYYLQFISFSSSLSSFFTFLISSPKKSDILTVYYQTNNVLRQLQAKADKQLSKFEQYTTTLRT